MRILAVLMILIGMVSTAALALEAILSDTSARIAMVRNMDRDSYFEDRRLVSQMRGVVSAGRVESNVFGTFDIQEINGRDTVCLLVGDECFAVAPSLSRESILRIGHWAVQGNFRVFSCLVTTSPEARDLVSQGFINAGRSGVPCGNQFVHPSLNSSELVNIFRYIDFGNSFAASGDEILSACQVDQTALGRAERAAASGRAAVSYVNMDVGNVYRLRTSRSNNVAVLSFSGSPTRNHWILPVTGSAIVFAVCPARRPLNQSQTRAIAFFHVAALFREAAMRDNRSVIEFINEHASSLP